MLVNEFLKKHEKVEELEATVAQLKASAAQQEKDFIARLKEQDAQIRKVSAEMEVSKFATGRIRSGGPAPQTVLNNQ